MKKSSTVHYTLENKNGHAETFNKQMFDSIVAKEQVNSFVQLVLENEGETIEVPLLSGYKEPYDYAFNDDIGTEHYIYYEELVK